MELLEPLTPSNLQPFIDNPEQLVSQNEGFQIAVANYPETPRCLLEVLVNSSNAQIAEAAQLHVNWAGEMSESWQEAVDEMLPHRQLGQNDRLAVELLKIAPVPEYFLSEWVPTERLIQGLRNPYMPLRYRLKLLLRLAQEPTLEPRLQVAESNETPGAVLEELAGDLELPIRLAVKFNPSCPPQLIELVEGQHAAATDWNTNAEQLALLGQSRWAWVRLAVAQNPNAPAETLMQLATDALLKIQLAVAQNPGTPFSVLAVLAEHPEKDVQAAVVVHANASLEILQQLFPTQQHLLRQQEDLPASILERFFNEAAIDTSIWKNSDLRHLLLRQANTPTWILAQLANVNLEALRAEKLATHQPPPLPEILEQWIQKDIRFLADVAKHPQVSVEILERLAQYLNPWVQLAVARNLKTPAPLRLQLLSELIHNPELRIQVEIASDPNTPTSILEQLARTFSIANFAVDTIRQMFPTASASLWDAIRAFIANHQSPEQILFWLRQDAVFRNPILQEWRQLNAHITKSDRATLNDICRQMLPAIGLSGGVPSEDNWLTQYQYPSPEFALYGLLLWFGLVGNRGNSENRVVSVALIGNPSTPAGEREQLQIQLTQPSDKTTGYLKDYDMRLAVAFNPQTQETQRLEFLQQAVSSRWEDIAKNPNTPVSILEQIAQRGAGGIQSIANNPKAPVNILRQAAQQDNSYTLELVAKNPSTPLDLLKDLVLNRGEKGVREAALKNPSLDRLTVYKIQLELQAQEETAKAHELLAHRADSPYALAQVLTSGDRNARMKAAGSHKTPIHVLEQLAKDPDETVRQTVSQNSNLPLNSLLQLVQDPSAKVRISLVYKPSHQKTSTPVQLLERLAQDEYEEVRAKVAEHPHTPVELLVRLASDSNRPVKASVVSNLKTPVTVLERLGLQENIFNVRNPNTPGNVLAQAVARLAPNPRSTTRRTVGYQSDESLADLIKFSRHTKGSQMPASVLSDLSYYGYCVVRSEVAAHPNTPATVLERLANDEWFPVRAGVAKHPNTPPHILELMARQEDPNGEGNFYYTVCSYIAQRSDTPVSALAFLSNSHMVQIHRIVAGNSSTTLEVLAQMVARETDESVLQSLARNPNLTSALLQLLAQKPYISVRILLIHHPNVTAEVWTLLTRDEDPIIRQAIAEDTDVPVDILHYLAQDENSDVRSRLATNSNISPECLEALAQDPDAGVRAAIASNSRTPEKILEQLAEDEKIEVRRAVAQNPNTPAPIREALRDLILQPATTRPTIPTLRGLSRLYNPNTDDLAIVLAEYAQSDNAFVRLVTLLHPLTPKDVLQQGARSQSWLERYAVADNPATPVELRQQLVQDGNRVVKATARAYL